VLVVETFTDAARHTGACCAAAKPREAGHTLGSAAAPGPGIITAAHAGLGLPARWRSCPLR
jgi:hypothetical protein